ncbi:PL29 family lyase N-terminal domain-containing protein [Bacteroides sp.]
MRRNIYSVCKGITSKCMLFLMTCTIVFTSCYNDDDLKDSISGLEDRVTKLENSLKDVQSDISTLKTLTDALSKNKSIASVLKNEDGSYTIKFSDDQEVNIPNGENGEKAPQITVIKNEEDGIYYWGTTAADGTKTFLLNDKGEKMPVTAVAPKIRINSQTKEWEISTDGGKTWEGTGVIASGDATGSTSLFLSVDQDDTYAYFELTDGTVLKLAKSTELKCDILSGKQYFEAGTSKVLKMDMSGVSKYTVTKPDGWKASVSGEGLKITAPAAENAYAETSGKVAVLAVAANGQSIISEIPVVIGTAPVQITATAQGISTTLATGVDIYYLGVMKLDEYNTENIAELVNGFDNRNYMKTEALANVSLADLLGSDPELGTTYMIWAAVSDGMEDITADDVMATSTSTPGTVTLTVSDITFEGATISAKMLGCKSFYGGIIEKGNYSQESVIEIIGSGWGFTTHSSDFNGTMTKYDSSNYPTVIPGITYVVWAIAKVEGKTVEDYTTNDIISTEVVIPALTYNGNATVTIGEVTSTTTSITATVTPGTNCYKFYYNYLYSANMDNYPDDQAIIDYLVKNGISSNEAAVYENSYLDPETQGFIVAVAVDKNGQVGSLAKVEANSKAIAHSSDISVDVTVNQSATSATFTLTPTGNITKYRYMHITEQEFAEEYPYGSDESKIRNILELNEYGSTEITPSELNNNQLVIEGLSFNTNYLFFMIAVDADGNLSEKMTKVGYKTKGLTWVRKTEANWESSKPEVEIIGTEKDGYFYTLNYKVTPATNCKEYYVFISDNEIFQGKMFDKKAAVVMENGQKYSGEQTLSEEYVSFPTMINIVWVDNDNKYYEMYSYDLPTAPGEEPAE